MTTVVTLSTSGSVAGNMVTLEVHPLFVSHVVSDDLHCSYSYTSVMLMGASDGLDNDFKMKIEDLSNRTQLGRQKRIHRIQLICSLLGPPRLQTIERLCHMQNLP